MTYKPNAKKLREKLFVTEKEFEAVKSLLDKKVNCYFQMIPTDSKQDIRALVEAFKS